MFGTWTAMPDRDKDRLYLVLAHRGMKRPGFHWALMVVPKKGSKNGHMQGAHVFHAVNTYTSANVPLDHNDNPLWRGATLEKEIIAFGELGSKTRFSDMKKAPLTEIPIPEKDIRLGRST
ncbi:predicted protein [Postia placenta Mad-698-R]|nr:predicted protein [Postia placenta Mad-698-R]